MLIDSADALPGDLVFCHGTGVVSRAIRLAERLHWQGGDFYNHVAVLDMQTPTGWTVIQAESRGVTRGRALSTIAPGGSYSIVRAPSDAFRADILAFARSQVGSDYGFLTIASIVLTILVPGSISFMFPNSWICSALAAEALRCGGWVHSWPVMAQVSPAQLWEALA